MTPMIYKKDRDPRPLFNPPVGTYRAADLPKLLALRQHRLSDYIVGLQQLAIKARLVTKRATDIFESDYVLGAKPRVIRNQAHDRGLPFLAPDGTALAIFGEVYGGSQNVAAGSWTLDNVCRAPGYAYWAGKLLGPPSAVVPDDMLFLPFTGCILDAHNAGHLARTTAALARDARAASRSVGDGEEKIGRKDQGIRDREEDGDVKRKDEDDDDGEHKERFGEEKEGSAAGVQNKQDGLVKGDAS